MKIIEVRDRNATLINELLEVWESSVTATHKFLSSDEIKNIKKYVPQALVNVAHLIIVENKDNIPIAFMGIEKKRLEMLFIQNNERGKGIGKQLLNYGINKYNVNELTVNEQNINAKGFYEYMGFTIYKRTELDEQDNPYPILYMKLKNKV